MKPAAPREPETPRGAGVFPAPGEGPPGRLRRAAAALAPPLLAWLLARAFFLVVAKLDGHAPFAAELWKRWDSHLYLLVSRLGYTLVPCEPFTGYAPTDWCGTAGWFPGLPLLVAAAARTGAAPDVAGAAIVAAFHLGSLLLVWNAFDAPRGLRGALLLALAALFPGAVYQHALFPVSGFVFFALLAMALLLRERLAAAGLAGAAAMLMHSTGVAFSAAAALWIVLRARQAGLRRTLLRLVAVPGAVAAGYAAVLATMHFSTGRWDAFFLVQAKYGHQLSNPLRTLFVAATRGPEVGGPGSPAWHRLVPALQTVATALAVAVAARATWRARQGPRHARNLLLLAYAAVLWLLPLFMGPKVGFYRTEALLLPVALLLCDAPLAGLALLAAFAALAAPVALLFFRSVLV